MTTAGRTDANKQHRLDQLRRRIAAIPGRTRDTTDELFDIADPQPASAQATEPPPPEPHRTEPDASDRGAKTPGRARASRRTLPVPDAIADLLPHRGLTRGTVTAVTGAHSTLLALIAATTAAGGYAAIIGLPKLGLLAAHEMGADLTHCAVIDNPGPDPTDIASVLLDGIDLVVLGLAGRAVPPSRARAITARTRTKGTVLVIADGTWPGVDLTLHTTVAGYTGLGAGHGRITGLELDVDVTGRAIRPRTGHLDLTGHRGTTTWTTRVDVTGALSKAL